MGSQVSLPLWVVLLMAILAILAALDRILIPSVRWALRRRTNRAIEELWDLVPDGFPVVIEA